MTHTNQPADHGQSTGKKKSIKRDGSSSSSGSGSDKPENAHVPYVSGVVPHVTRSLVTEVSVCGVTCAYRRVPAVSMSCTSWPLTMLNWPAVEASWRTASDAVPGYVSVLLSYSFRGGYVCGWL